MKHSIAAALSMGAGLALAAPAQAEWRTYEIDPEHFSVAAGVMHIGYYTQFGLFTEGEGSFRFNEETRELADVRVEIEADSYYTGHRGRDRHVRSDDFLNAGEHPTISFVMTDAQALSDNTGTVSGELTVNGVTQPVTLDVTWNRSADYPFGHGEYTIGIDAQTEFNRSDFGMTYALDGDLVGDRVRLFLGFEALAQD